MRISVLRNTVLDVVGTLHQHGKKPGHTGTVGLARMVSVIQFVQLQRRLNRLAQAAKFMILPVGFLPIFFSGSYKQLAQSLDFAFFG